MKVYLQTLSVYLKQAVCVGYASGTAFTIDVLTKAVVLARVKVLPLDRRME